MSEKPASKKIASRMVSDPEFRQAYVHHVRGDLERAAEHYIRSIEKEPSPEAHTFLAKVLGELGEIDAAMEECRNALELDPNFGSANNDLGAFLLERRKFTEAEKYLKKAVEAKDYENPEFPRFNLARFYSTKGMMLQATHELRTAIKLNPAFTPAQDLLTKIESQLH